jgi:hypothetical protein
MTGLGEVHQGSIGAGHREFRPMRLSFTSAVQNG